MGLYKSNLNYFDVSPETEIFEIYNTSIRDVESMESRKK